MQPQLLEAEKERVLTHYVRENFLHIDGYEPETSLDIEDWDPLPTSSLPRQRVEMRKALELVWENCIEDNEGRNRMWVLTIVQERTREDH